MKHLVLLPFLCLSLIFWLSGCVPPGPNPGSLVQLLVDYSPQEFLPGDTVTIKVEIKNIGETIIKPQPEISSLVLNGTKAIIQAPESYPYVTSLDPGKSVSKTFNLKLKCKNQISIKASIPGVGWDGEVIAQPCVSFYQDCVDRVNKLRALENLNPLVRDQGNEDSADNDARINYVTNIPHSSVSGDAQNECLTYSNTSLILDECIEKQMYYAEKLCYEKNPGGCYMNNTCQCGHYVNITGNSFSELACGFYETPDGKFKAVLNFFK